jgi:signal transduction histidine kinase/ActR/RegA family two-component response regulator
VNVAAALALTAASVNIASSTLHLAVSRARAWRAERTFAAIAFSAGLYNLTGLVFATGGLSDATYLAVGRFAYAIASVQCVAWLLYAFGGPDAALRDLSTPVRALILTVLGVSIVVTATGVHLAPIVTAIDVPWAGVQYHLPVTTPVGDVFGLLMPAVLGLVVGRFVWRFRRGDRFLGGHLAGLAVFYVCTVVEYLVASRVIVFLSLADLGMVAVVLPATIYLVERLTRDSARLTELSGQLAGEVQKRTQERDRAETALVEAERMAALGQLAAGVGHEINNPLTYMQLALEEVDAYVASAGSPPRIREAVDHALDGSFRIQRVVEGLRSFSRRPEERRTVNPREVVTAALKVAEPHLRHVARVETAFGASMRVIGDEPRLVQALVNLLINAGQAVEDRRGSGTIIVSTSRDDERMVRIAVEDDGPGIPTEHRARLMEPYFTTRAHKGGLGLGLFVSRGIVDAHGGRLEIDPRPDSGTRVSMVLPGMAERFAPKPTPQPVGRRSADRVPAALVSPDRVEPTAAAVSAAPEPRTVAPAPAAHSPEWVRPPVLVIDDEPMIADFLKSGLKRSWAVACAGNAADALHMVSRQPFEAVICDLMMPGMSGMELADVLARQHPALRRRTVFLTGGAVTESAEEFLERPDVVYMTKPVRLKDLDAMLRSLMEQGAPPSDPPPTAG